MRPGPWIVVVVAFAACGPDDRRPRGRRPDPAPPATEATDELVLGEARTCSPVADWAEQPFDRVLLPDPIAPEGSRNLIAGGLVIADLTGDGRTDLLVPGNERPILWAQGDDRAFEDVADAWFAPDVPFLNSVGGSVADYDADGDLDLYVTQLGQADLLLRNDGDAFVDVTASAGIAGAWRSVSAAWGDYDADGWLDLVVGGYDPKEPTVLWRNRGDGTFEDRSDLFPPEVHEAWTFMTAWHDLEGDGWPDLFLANDYFQRQPCQLLANRDGAFTIDTSSGYHPGFHGMGLTLADFDDDGLPDPVETTFSGITLLLSAPRPQAMQGVIFVSAGAAHGVYALPEVEGQVFGWGVDAGDLDNDADLDLVASYGHWDSRPTNPLLQADSRWLRTGDTFERQPDHDWGEERGLLMVDLDDDGVLEVVKRNLGGDDTVDWGRCAGGHWLEVELRDTGPNTRGIGATVSTWTDGEPQTRWMQSGSSSIFSGGPPVVHFGLGSADRVERLEVRWPDGRLSTFEDLPADRRVTVNAP